MSKLHFNIPAVSSRKPFDWLTKDARRFMGKDYLAGSDTAEDRLKVIAEGFAAELGIDSNAAEAFLIACANGWVSPSTPVWANSWVERGLPISCFGSFIEDSMSSILGTAAEVGMMSKIGGGTSAYFGNLRPRGSSISTGGESFGSVHFMSLFDTTTKIVSQGSTRRGSFAAYQRIDHPDILEFLTINSPSHSIQDFSIGVTVPDWWLQEMEAGDKEKRKIWTAVLKKRFETGYPYIMFIDTVNENKPQVYKDKGEEIVASNLCSEISLPSNKDESFVCCLSSVNLLYYEEWKDTDLIRLMTYFLDCIMSEFIRKAKEIPYMDRAVRFAERHRALGLGVVGWHSFLQSKMIPFESLQAKSYNAEIFNHMDEKSLEATKELAILLGEPEILRGYGQRNTTRITIPPTTSSSTILGVSPSVEPWDSNYINQKLAKGNFTTKNSFLFDLLKKKGVLTPELSKDILIHGGSVQHLDCLDEHEKDVFKTYGETSQMEIIIQAGQRQKYIDQGQSINLKIHPKTPLKDVNRLVLEAWKRKVCALYYQKGTNPSQELSRKLTECAACSG